MVPGPISGRYVWGPRTASDHAVQIWRLPGFEVHAVGLTETRPVEPVAPTVIGGCLIWRMLDEGLDSLGRGPKPTPLKSLIKGFRKRMSRRLTNVVFALRRSCVLNSLELESRRVFALGFVLKKKVRR